MELKASKLKTPTVSEVDTKAIKLYSVLVGHDYMTGNTLKLAKEFGADYSEAEKLVAEHPEIKEVYQIIKKRFDDKLRIEKNLAKRYDEDRKRLRLWYNDLCEETGRKDYIEEFYD